MIKGETVILVDKTEVGRDAFNAPVFEEIWIEVQDVCIGIPTFEQSVNEYQLYGKRLAFTLGIPKTDVHEWKDREVMIRGERFRTYGFPMTQTPENVPGRWNTQVKVERYG